MIVIALVKREEPDVCAKEEDRDTVDEEQPVEDDEGCLAPQGDENEGAGKGCQEDDSQHSSTCRER